MKKWIQAPYIDQTERYPTGCESVSAVMLLHYLGIPITVDAFIDDYLEKAPVISRKGRLYGPDPFLSFAGSPYDAASFGCYAPGIANALNRVFAAQKPEYLAKDITGMPVSKMLAQFLDRDMPVVFWASLDMKETVPGPKWQLPDGSVFTWRSNEHCMLLMGYEEDALYFNDPWQNHGCMRWPLSLVERRHKEQRGLAVAVIKEGKYALR